MKIFFNGNYYAKNESLVKVFDRGLLFGDGIFTTLKVKNSVPLYIPIREKLSYKSLKSAISEHIIYNYKIITDEKGIRVFA